jgi:hypothetical protein
MRHANARMRCVSRTTAANLETHVSFTKHLERKKPPKTKRTDLVEIRPAVLEPCFRRPSGVHRTDLSPGRGRYTSKTRQVLTVQAA